MQNCSQLLPMGRLYPCLSGIFQTFGDVNDDYDKEDVGCYVVRFPDPLWNFHSGSGNLTRCIRMMMKKKFKAPFPREFCSSYLTSSGPSWRVVVSTPWSMASTISRGLSLNVKDYFLVSEMKTMLLLTRRETKSSGTLPGSSTARYEVRTWF